MRDGVLKNFSKEGNSLEYNGIGNNLKFYAFSAGSWMKCKVIGCKHPSTLSPVQLSVLLLISVEDMFSLRSKCVCS